MINDNGYQRKEIHLGAPKIAIKIVEKVENRI